MNAGWDAEMLSLELADLSAIGTDLSMLGFTTKELSAALSRVEAGLTDEDEVPEVAEVAVSQPGDIWQLGPHRIACGDSRDSGLVQSLFAGIVPQLMVTDPPYGVEYDPEWRHRRGVNKSARTGKVKNDEIADWTPTWELFPGEIAYVWHGALRCHASLPRAWPRAGFTIRAQIIWAKERLVLSRGDYHWQHEPCWYAVRKKGHWTGDRKQTTLWTIPTGGQDAETEHGTQKPVECMRRPILNNSARAGDLRAVPGQRHHDDRGAVQRAGLPRHRDRSVLCGCRYPALAGVHRGESEARERWRVVRGAFADFPFGRGGVVMRGRRPKPSRIKALTGNPGKRPLNAHEPRPEPALPECPPELSPAGRREWERLSAELSLSSIWSDEASAPNAGLW